MQAPCKLLKACPSLLLFLFDMTGFQDYYFEINRAHLKRVPPNNVPYMKDSMWPYSVYVTGPFYLYLSKDSFDQKLSKRV